MNGAIFNLAYKSVTNRLFTVGLTVLAIAMSVTLFLGVTRSGPARESFSTTISGTDLIVGVQFGSINLLLYSVFRGQRSDRRDELGELASDRRCVRRRMGRADLAGR